MIPSLSDYGKHRNEARAVGAATTLLSLLLVAFVCVSPPDNRGDLAGFTVSKNLGGAEGTSAHDYISLGYSSHPSREWLAPARLTLRRASAYSEWSNRPTLRLDNMLRRAALLMLTWTDNPFGEAAYPGSAHAIFSQAGAQSGKAGGTDNSSVNPKHLPTDEAAVAALKAAYAQPEALRKEFGGVIYMQKKDGSFGFSDPTHIPVPGEPDIDATEVHLSHRPKHTTIAALYHSHSNAQDRSNEFSDVDLDVAWAISRAMHTTVELYMGDANGGVYRCDADLRESSPDTDAEARVEGDVRTIVEPKVLKAMAPGTEEPVTSRPANVAEATSAGGLALSREQPAQSGTRRYVPDEATAVRIAEAVLLPIYGPSELHAEQPLRAKLRGDDWIVHGNLHKPVTSRKVMFSGTMIVEINRTTGAINSLYHSK